MPAPSDNASRAEEPRWTGHGPGLYTAPMLSFFGRLSRSWLGPVIIGAATLAFVALGSSSSVRDILSGRTSNAVVQAGNHTVTSTQFQSMFQRNEQEYLTQTGQPYPLEEAVRQGADRQMLNQLAAQVAYQEMLSRSGIRPSAEVVAMELKREAEAGDNPGLAHIFDSVTGKFSETGLAELLQALRISRDEFFKELTESVADQDFTTAVQQGFQPPRMYASIQATLLLESRDATYFVIPASSVPPPPQPTDTQLNALIQQYKDQLMQPERRVLSVVRFSAKTLAPTMPVAPAAIQQQFEAKKNTYGRPETRSLIEIPLNDPSKAPQVVAALKAGQDPETVAKSVGVEAVTYTSQPQSAVADRKAADVAFKMTPGEVAGPVQGDFKPVVIKLISITPGQPPDLNTAKPQIIADLQMQEATDKVYDLTQKFEDLVQGGASLQDAAAKLGLTVLQVGPVTADGKDVSTGQPDPAVSRKLLASAFQLAKGASSDGVEQDSGKGEYFYVRVDQVTPPGPPTLAEPGVRAMLTQAYFQQAIVGALEKKGADAQAALAKGKTMEAVAAVYGAHVAHQVGMTRAAAQQLVQTLGQDFLAAVFDAKVGATFVAGSDPLKGYVVGRLDAIHPADPKQAATLLDALGERNAQRYLQGIDDATRQAAVRMVKPRTNLKLARSVMGIDEAMVRRATSPQTGAPRPAQ